MQDELRRRLGSEANPRRSLVLGQLQNGVVQLSGVQRFVWIGKACLRGQQRHRNAIDLGCDVRLGKARGSGLYSDECFAIKFYPTCKLLTILSGMLRRGVSWEAMRDYGESR